MVKVTKWVEFVDARETSVFLAVVAYPDKVPVITPAFIVTPDIAVAEATYKLPPIPTPPETVNAPVPVLVETVEDPMYTAPCPPTEKTIAPGLFWTSKSGDASDPFVPLITIPDPGVL